MQIFKHPVILAAIFAVLPVFAMAQTRPGFTAGNSEVAVEQSYLQESVEFMIISEQSRTESQAMKLAALESIREAIGRGYRNEEIHSTLEFLALEGVVNQVRQSGRIVNDFPAVRTRAAAYLGELGTPEAHKTLITIVGRDNESMVVTEAIKSLGKIGTDNSGEAVSAIARTVNRFGNVNPDNILALAAIDAFEKISEANGGQPSQTAIQALMRISEGRYTRPVQERAIRAIANMRRLN